MFWKLQENVLDQDDFEVLMNFIKTTKRFTQFTKVREFEREFSKWQGCQYSVFVNSGSSANLLLINTLKGLRGWTDEDEIIVSTVTWPTNITPVIQNNLKPVFVDVNLQDLSFNYQQLQEAITPKTKAIFITHLLGFPADVNKIKKIIKDRDITILEDCCESHGAQVDGIKVGNLGLGSTFSFYWGHHMTTIEGGMICTDNEELYKMLLLKRSHGLARELPEEYHEEIKRIYPDMDFKFLFLTDGFNVRNTELQAVLGLTQLKKLDSFIKKRNENYQFFLDICSKYDDLILIKRPGVSAFVLPFVFKKREKKEWFQRFIAENGIESRPLVTGNTLRQPFLKGYFQPEGFRNADFLHFNAFYIGNNQFVNKDRIKFLDSLMKQFFNKQTI